MSQTTRVYFEIKELLQRYYDTSEWRHFDIKSEAVPKRRQEYFAGRVCAALAYEKIFSKQLSELQSRHDRSPIWPEGVVGSISHNEKFVAAELSEHALSLGIDIVTLGSVNNNLAVKVCHPDELKNLSPASNEQLLSFIFSFKESLFKAIYPLINEFFDFQSAQVIHIDFAKKNFKIVLEKKYSAILRKKALAELSEEDSTFSGDYVYLDSQTILSRIVVGR